MVIFLKILYKNQNSIAKIDTYELMIRSIHGRHKLVDELLRFEHIKIAITKVCSDFRESIIFPWAII